MTEKENIIKEQRERYERDRVQFENDFPIISNFEELNARLDGTGKQAYKDMDYLMFGLAVTHKKYLSMNEAILNSDELKEIKEKYPERYGLVLADLQTMGTQLEGIETRLSDLQKLFVTNEDKKYLEDTKKANERQKEYLKNK